MTKIRQSVLILGGAGYVGSALAMCLAKAGFHVTSVDSLLWNQQHTLQALSGVPNLVMVKGNIGIPSTWSDFAAQADTVVLMAALVGDPITHKYPKLAREINEVATSRAMQAVVEAQTPRLVFASTCSNYGVVRSGEPAQESTPLNPISLYAKQKVKMEAFLMSLCANTETEPVVLRLATAFGHSPRMRFDLTVAHFVKDAVLRGSLEVFDADTWRPYCHVEDIAVAVTSAIEAPRENVAGQIFNVGNERNNLTKRQIVEMVQLACPKVDVSFIKGGEDARDYRVSFSKARAALGFEANWLVSDYIPKLKESLLDGRYPLVSQDPNFYGNYVLRP